MDAGSHVATPQTSARVTTSKRARTTFSPTHVATLERHIVRMTKQLPALSSFIIPSGGRAAASLHVCRTVCRRAERCLVPLRECGDLDGEVLRWVNRLSDYFFVAARLAGQHAARAEEEELTYARPDGRGSQRAVGRHRYAQTRAAAESTRGADTGSGSDDGDGGDEVAAPTPASAPTTATWPTLLLGIALGVLVAGAAPGLRRRMG